MTIKKEGVRSTVEALSVVDTLKLALEALEGERVFTLRPDHEGKELTPAKVTNAITAIRAALMSVPDGAHASTEREQPVQQGCMRCNTPKKCALYGCSSLTWPAEQPAQQQEPVAWAQRTQELLEVFDVDHPEVSGCCGVSPPANANAGKPWAGLTDEERGQAINANFGTGLWAMAKDIEAKLKEKNGF